MQGESTFRVGPDVTTVKIAFFGSTDVGRNAIRTILA